MKNAAAIIILTIFMGSVIGCSKESPATIDARKFYREMGCSIITYIQNSKLERACYLLANTIRSVDDISAELGFNARSYFTTVFKNHIGMSPTEYRRENAIFGVRSPYRHTGEKRLSIFGEWLEGLAIFINQAVYGGWKSGTSGCTAQIRQRMSSMAWRRMGIRAGSNPSRRAPSQSPAAGFRAANTAPVGSGSGASGPSPCPAITASTIEISSRCGVSRRRPSAPA